MNRKDFELVARVIKSLKDETLARAFANALDAAHNCAGFDRAKFLAQCGVKP